MPLTATPDAIETIGYYEIPADGSLTTSARQEMFEYRGGPEDAKLQRAAEGMRRVDVKRYTFFTTRDADKHSEPLLEFCLQAVGARLFNAQSNVMQHVRHVRKATSSDEALTIQFEVDDDHLGDFLDYLQSAEAADSYVFSTDAVAAVRNEMGKG